MSDSSDLDFEGFLEGSFDIDVIERQHDTVDSDSDTSLDEDISNSADHDEKKRKDVHSEKILLFQFCLP